MCWFKTICRQNCKSKLVLDRNRKSSFTIIFLPVNTGNTL